MAARRRPAPSLGPGERSQELPVEEPALPNWDSLPTVLAFADRHGQSYTYEYTFTDAKWDATIANALAADTKS